MFPNHMKKLEKLRLSRLSPPTPCERTKKNKKTKIPRQSSPIDKLVHGILVLFLG
jgi:hypothetical protein